MGTGDIKGFTTPVEVTALRHTKIQQVACGHNFSVAVTDSGHVYCWGKGGQGQCGYKYAEDQALPRRVEGVIVRRQRSFLTSTNILLGGVCHSCVMWLLPFTSVVP